MDPEILRVALAPSAECLSIERLGRYADRALSADEQNAAAAHIRGCLNCQAELALLHAVTSTDVRPEEADVVRDGVARVEPRTAAIVSADRVQPSSDRRTFRFPTVSLAAVAAVLLIGIASGSFYLFTRNAPELPNRVTTGDEVTRSLAVTLRGPLGDQADVPRTFEWLAVDRAARYRVRLMEVDRHEVWSTSTSARRVDVPPPVRASIAPARTLLWDVTAYDAAGAAIAQSGTQSFRVLPR